MRKHLSYGILFLTCLLSVSCGEDRSGEYYALIATKTWMYDTMEENYLYYDELPEKDDVDFFKKPAEFLRAVISSKDQKSGVYFSHIDSVFTESRSVSDNPSFGIESTLLRDSNTGKYYARVLYVQQDSPAEEGGLRRGDWILDVDSTSITTSNYSSYVSTPTQPHLYHIARTDENGLPDTLYVSMGSPRYVVEPSVYKTRYFTTASGKGVFYLMYNHFSTGNDETELKSAFNEGMGNSPDYVVLDLRYNPGGYISTALLLATMLAPESALGSTCLNLIYNDKIDKTEQVAFDSSLLTGTANFSFEHLYILTTGSTASAAEVIINCLRPYLGSKISQVGDYTFGKNVAQTLFTNENYPQLEFWLTTAYVSNANGYYDYYTSGLTPDYILAEDTSGDLGELGTEADALMTPVLYHIENGVFPSSSTETESGAPSRRISAGQFSEVTNTVASKPKLSKWNISK